MLLNFGYISLGLEVIGFLFSYYIGFMRAERSGDSREELNGVERKREKVKF